MRVGLLSSVLISACSPSNTDVEKGPVSLQCDGVATFLSYGETRETTRKTFRIDGKAKTFEQWQENEAAFEPWGDGELTIARQDITYFGSNRIGIRKVRINRASGEVTDNFNVTIGPGTGIFTGICKPVSKPARQKQKF